MPAGRPTTYNERTCDLILDQLSSGRDVDAICSAKDMPAASTFYRWLMVHPELQERYARACEVRGHVFANRAIARASQPLLGEVTKTEETGEDGPVTTITTSDNVARSKLEVDTLKWAAEKLTPKVYGNKQFVEHSGSIALTDASDDDLRAEFMDLLAKGYVKLPEGAQIVEEDDFSDLA